MTPAERGFLLLTSRLGIPDRKVLTAPQLCRLTQTMASLRFPEKQRDLKEGDLKEIGIGGALEQRIMTLLSQEEELDYYLSRAARARCVPLTRASGDYPDLLRRRLGPENPGGLWAKGDLSLLRTPAVSLVGSRDLREENYRFAQAVGRQAANQGFTLVSGNARGADRTAQEACLEAGGKVISIVADDLESKEENRNILYLSEEDFDAHFSARRALSRNRCIHALGGMVFVAQVRAGKGGTWKGTAENLKNLWSTVYVFRDGTPGAQALEALGAYQVTEGDLADLGRLNQQELSFFESQEGFL